IAPDTSSDWFFHGTNFTGVFNGAGFKVTNLTIDTAGAGNNYLGMFGYIGSGGRVNNLTAEDVNITGGNGSRYLGGLVGANDGTIRNCYAIGSVTGRNESGGLGGLAGGNSGTIRNCYATGSVTGDEYLGGLVGYTCNGTISNCFSTSQVTGDEYLGGLVGYNDYWAIISNCFSTSQVTGDEYLGGLVGYNSERATVNNCYSTGPITGDVYPGGLVGYNYGTISDCFWDVNTSCLDTSDGGIGKTTVQMQMQSTYTDAGWDFTTPVWKICETADYPRLAWQKIPAPILYPEPDITTGTENTITWQDVNEAVEYYAICCNDPNLEELIMDSGWIDTNEVTFAGLNAGQTYYYAVKARQNCVMESDFSNIESSMQGTLGDAVDAMLDPNSLKNANMANALSNKIDEVLAMIEAGNYQAALKKLKNDILKKTDGCANSGEPDKNDWIVTCEQQGRIYPLIMETIEYVKSLIE
ncbi:MAG: GLUG motif-containing protein, partial [Planctomycetota bacterium]